MKKLVILIMMIILMGCGDKEITEKDIKTLTEGEKQALLLINRVTSKNPNIITIKDRLIVDSLIVELYGKGALKGGTKENEVKTCKSLPRNDARRTCERIRYLKGDD